LFVYVHQHLPHYVGTGRPGQAGVRGALFMGRDGMYTHAHTCTQTRAHTLIVLLIH
jgi:hypothetical protein